MKIEVRCQVTKPIDNLGDVILAERRRLNSGEEDSKRADIATDSVPAQRTGLDERRGPAHERVENYIAGVAERFNYAAGEHGR